VSAPRQVLISPERYGWIRVLCDTEATPARIVGVQRQLSAAGVYQGPIDGRYDANTTAAVERFQSQRHIEDRGYLSYSTLSALNVYSQRQDSQSGYAQGVYDRNGYFQVASPNLYPNPQNGYAPPYAYAYPQARPWAYGNRPLTTFDTGVITWPGKR
jgi:peptidoglycan hydrolase-like protein with peptidoglycan-binding domain